MIEIFTENLPFKLSEQLTIEYNRRLSDVNYFISGQYDYYAPLKESVQSIRLLLALSIFYKRVISNFDSATKFSARVVFGSNADSIQLGTYDFSKREIFKLNKSINAFRKLMDDYSIPIALFEYLETKEFLRKVKVYKDSLGRNNNNG